MQNPASCCPGRPAHSRSRAFFQAAATLALIAGGVSGSLSTQALAVDYTNPLGSTDSGKVYTNDSAPTNFTNAGTSGGLDAYNNPTSPISTFNNSGTINGAFSAVNLRDYTTINSLTNSGNINASVFSFYLFNNAVITTLTNTGIISSEATAFIIASNSSITSLNNSGTIRGIVGGPNVWTRGIDNQSGGTIGTLTNSGTLSGYQYGIVSGGIITTLNNSGAITGTNAAISNSGTIGTLNLLTGSVITGGISNSGTIGTLNVYKIVTNANFDSASLVPTISGNQPGATNVYLTTPANCKYVSIGGRTIGIDTSGFGANTNAVRQVSNSVSRLANTNRLIESIGAKAAKVAAEPYAMTSDLCADGATAPAQFGNSDFWIRGFTGRNKVDASASSSDYINTYSGGAIGIDRDWSDDVRGGFFIGSGNMNNSLGGGLGGTETDLIFAGIYATKTWGTLFAKVGLTGGRGNNTGTRNIAAGTPETATADYNSLYVSPEVSVGKVYALGQYLGGDFSVTPMLSVRYVYARQEGYTETGATNNLTMNRSHSTTLEERAELKFSYATKAFNDYGVKVNASVGGIGQQNNGGAMSGTLLGAPLSFATPGDDNSTGFVGGLGFEVNRGKYTFTASGDYVRLSGGNADLSANVVFSVKF